MFDRNDIKLSSFVGIFDEDLSTILSVVPSSHQTLLFTATNSPSVTSVINTCNNNHLQLPRYLLTSTVEKLCQKYLLTSPEAKDSYLVQLLLSRTEKNAKTSSIVFCRTCRQTELIGMLLTKVGLNSSTLHSIKPQKERRSSLASFKSGHAKIHVACGH